MQTFELNGQLRAWITEGFTRHSY